MTYAEFQDYVAKSCMYETIYSDTEGREILIIALLDAYFMAKRTPRPWVGLTMLDMAELRQGGFHNITDEHFRAIEAKLKEKNT